MQHQEDQLLIDQFLLDWDDFSLGSRADEYESSPEDQHLEKYLEHDSNCDILHSLSSCDLGEQKSQEIPIPNTIRQHENEDSFNATTDKINLATLWKANEGSRVTELSTTRDNDDKNIRNILGVHIQDLHNNSLSSVEKGLSTKEIKTATETKLDDRMPIRMYQNHRRQSILSKNDDEEQEKLAMERLKYLRRIRIARQEAAAANRQSSNRNSSRTIIAHSVNIKELTRRKFMYPHLLMRSDLKTPWLNHQFE